MSEEAAAPAPPPKRSIWRIILAAAIVILAAAIAALLVYQFFLRSDSEASEQTAESAENMAEAEGTQSVLPEGATEVAFDQANVTVRKEPESDRPASLLLYKVSFLVSSPEAATLVKSHRSWFVDMLRELHSDLPRQDLENKLVVESIKKQALARANNILDELGALERDRVLKVFHEEFLIYDQY
jgi:flagellar basal body-associated protein FliL